MLKFVFKVFVVLVVARVATEAGARAVRKVMT